MTLRFGTSRDGLPVGIRLVSRWFAEFAILLLALPLESVSDVRDVDPEVQAACTSRVQLDDRLSAMWASCRIVAPQRLATPFPGVERGGQSGTRITPMLPETPASCARASGRFDRKDFIHDAALPDGA